MPSNGRAKRRGLRPRGKRRENLPSNAPPNNAKLNNARRATRRRGEARRRSDPGKATPQAEARPVVAGVPLDIVPAPGQPPVAKPRGPIETVVATVGGVADDIKNKTVVHRRPASRTGSAPLATSFLAATGPCPRHPRAGCHRRSDLLTFPAENEWGGAVTKILVALLFVLAFGGFAQAQPQACIIDCMAKNQFCQTPCADKATACRAACKAGDRKCVRACKSAQRECVKPCSLEYKKCGAACYKRR